MRFEWSKAEALAGTLLYRAAEHSIDFEPAARASLEERAGSHGSTSLLVGTLQLEVAVETAELLFPWGLFPKTRWEIGTLQAPNFTSGRVRLASAEPLKPGVSHAVPAGESWRIVRDGISGWICVGETFVDREAIAVEYATDAALVLVGDQLVSLWLRPLM